MHEMVMNSKKKRRGISENKSCVIQAGKQQHVHNFCYLLEIFHGLKLNGNGKFHACILFMMIYLYWLV